MNYTVSILSKRPASDKEECFYCHEAIGSNHKADCVFIRKKVQLRMTVEFEAIVPNHWGKKMIEFHRNDGTYCADNDFRELIESAEKAGGCLCGITNYEYLKDVGQEFLDES
jgi:hypothetical protein